MMKVVNTRDPVTQVQPSYLVAMLECLTMSGHDCWDLLIALKPGECNVWGLNRVLVRAAINILKHEKSLQTSCCYRSGSYESLIL